MSSILTLNHSLMFWESAYFVKELTRFLQNMFLHMWKFFLNVWKNEDIPQKLKAVKKVRKVVCSSNKPEKIWGCLTARARWAIYRIKTLLATCLKAVQSFLIFWYYTINSHLLGEKLANYATKPEHALINYSAEFGSKMASSFRPNKGLQNYEANFAVWVQVVYFLPAICLVSGHISSVQHVVLSMMG